MEHNGGSINRDESFLECPSYSRPHQGPYLDSSSLGVGSYQRETKPRPCLPEQDRIFGHLLDRLRCVAAHRLDEFEVGEPIGRRLFADAEGGGEPYYPGQRAGLLAKALLDAPPAP